jgi:acetyl/propionyl-CoA carboxylase alpha subunit
MRHQFLLNDQEHSLWLARVRGSYQLDIDGARTPVAIKSDGRSQMLTCGKSETPVFVAVDGERVYIQLDGEAHEIVYRDPVVRYAEEAGGAAEDTVKAPMPGTVISTPVASGQEVKVGDVLIVIESMKLETALKAGRDGVVDQVHVQAGRTFDRDAVLVTLVPQEG